MEVKRKGLMALSIALALALAVTACMQTTPTPTPAPTPTPSPTPMLTRVAEFDGYVVTLNECYWEGDELTTVWQFFNERAQKNRSISIYAYDQDGNRVWGDWDSGRIPPILWPGETEHLTAVWRAGPRSSEVIMTVTEAGKGAWPKEEEIPTAKASFSITRTCTVSPTPIPTPTLPVPPTDPAPGPTPGPLTTPGYAYDDELGYGFDYPGGWEMQVTLMADLLVQIEEDIESVLMLTKPGTPTTLWVTVSLSDLTTLEEVKVEFREAVEKIGATIFEQTEITVGGREGYEVIYSPFPSIKMRQVMFIANGKSYMIVCSTTEQLYDEYEETFDSIIGSFTIK